MGLLFVSLCYSHLRKILILYRIAASTTNIPFLAGLWCRRRTCTPHCLRAKISRQYMAAELFLEGGIHSFASDLWQLRKQST